MLSPVNGHVSTALLHGRSCVWIIVVSETRNNPVPEVHPLRWLHIMRGVALSPGRGANYRQSSHVSGVRPAGGDNRQSD